MRNEQRDWQEVYKAGIKACPALKNESTYIIHKWLEQYPPATISAAISQRNGKPIPHWDYLTPVIEEYSLKQEVEQAVDAPPIPITDEAKAKHIRYMKERGIRMPHEERWLAAYERNNPAEYQPSGVSAV